MKHNILHVVNIYFVLPYFVGDQFNHFRDKGYGQNVICSPSGDLAAYAKKMGFNYLEVNILRKINPLRDIVAIIKICRYIRKNRIDIVVGHTPKGALLAMLAANIMRVERRIYFRHGLVYETMKGYRRTLMINIDRLTARCATKIVCVSPSTYGASIRDRLNTKKKQVILGRGTCGGIDATHKFNPENIEHAKLRKLRVLLNIESNAYVLGYCGRLVKDKGLIELVDAFEQLQKEYDKSLKLLLVGDYEERDALPKRTIEKIKNNKHIIVTGFVFNEIEYYYSLMNIFILPSYREGFPTSVLEASAMRLPVITTKATGCIDAIAEGHTGIFVSNNKDSLLNGIKSMMKNEENILYGSNGRRHVLEYYDNRILWPIIEEELYS